LSLFEKLTVSQLVTKFYAYMKPEGSLSIYSVKGRNIWTGGGIAPCIPNVGTW